MKLFNETALHKTRGTTPIRFEWFIAKVNHDTLLIKQMCFMPRKKGDAFQASILTYEFNWKTRVFASVTPRPEDEYDDEDKANDALDWLSHHYDRFNDEAARIAMKNKAWDRLYDHLQGLPGHMTYFSGSVGSGRGSSTYN